MASSRRNSDRAGFSTRRSVAPVAPSWRLDSRVPSKRICRDIENGVALQRGADDGPRGHAGIWPCVAGGVRLSARQLMRTRSVTGCDWQVSTKPRFTSYSSSAKLASMRTSPSSTCARQVQQTPALQATSMAHQCRRKRHVEDGPPRKPDLEHPPNAVGDHRNLRHLTDVRFTGAAAVTCSVRQQLFERGRARSRRSSQAAAQEATIRPGRRCRPRRTLLHRARRRTDRRLLRCPDARCRSALCNLAGQRAS